MTEKVSWIAVQAEPARSLSSVAAHAQGREDVISVDLKGYWWLCIRDRLKDGTKPL